MIFDVSNLLLLSSSHKKRPRTGPRLSSGATNVHRLCRLPGPQFRSRSKQCIRRVKLLFQIAEARSRLYLRQFAQPNSSLFLSYNISRSILHDLHTFASLRPRIPLQISIDFMIFLIKFFMNSCKHVFEQTRFLNSSKRLKRLCTSDF